MAWNLSAKQASGRGHGGFMTIVRRSVGIGNGLAQDVDPALRRMSTPSATRAKKLALDRVGPSPSCRQQAFGELTPWLLGRHRFRARICSH